MRYALPVVLVTALAAVFALSPGIEPQRLRSRARLLAEQLRSGYGFREGSKAPWAQARSTGWPPFHYGGHGELDNVLIGELYGVPVRVAGYELTFNGSRHRYGLALLVLPYPLEWMEVRGERPFSAAWVAEHVPDGRVKLRDADFDALWNVYAETVEARRPVDNGELAAAMLDAPTTFNWRTDRTEVLLWKRGGWRDAPQLLASIGCVIGLLRLGETDRQVTG